MRKLVALLAVVAGIALAVQACGGDPEVAGSDAGSISPDTGGGVPTRGYSGSASRGDLVVFQIDPEHRTYTVHNETTNQDENGSYSILDGDFAGIKEVTANGKRFFAVELDDKVLAANFPVANSQANIYAGISSDIDNTGKEAQISGTYSWIHLTDEPINGSSTIKEWGILSVLANGTFKKWNFASGAGTGTPAITPMAPEALAAPVPPTSTPSETGTWGVAGSAKERLAVTIDGLAGVTLTGFAYAAEDASVFLLDLGTGKGFMLGLKNPAAHYTRAEIAGTYRFIDLWYAGSSVYRGAGTYLLPATGDGTYDHKSEDGSLATGYLQGIEACPNIPNMFVITKMQWGSTTTQDDDNVIRFAVVGKVVLHFTFDAEGNFVSYGVGARLE
ncbi:MAG: hypothetical protein HY901_20050 [Deltaproteobacteria bacterium]|nr:hypothetical protein [Deltaproteobacteria bacterium]